MSKLLRDAVLKAMEDSGRRPKEAKALLFSRASNDLLLREALIALGADQAVRSYYSTERHAASSMARCGVPGIIVETPERAERLRKKANRRLFWDRYALFGQMPLREATRPDLRTSVENRKKQAAGNIICANFESAVAKRLPNDDAIVWKVLGNDKLMELARRHHVIE